MHASRALAAALVVAAAGLSGCPATSETREGADALRKRLRTPPPGQSVRVVTGRDGQGVEYVETVVVLSSAATAEQVAGVVVVHPGHVQAAGLGPGFNSRRLRFERRPNARLVVRWSQAVAPQGIESGASRWLAVADALRPRRLSSELSTTGPLTHTIELAAGEPAAVAVAYRRLRSRRGLAAPADSWDVSAKAAGLELSLRSATLPTAAQLATWRSLVGATRRLGGGLAASHLALSQADRAVVDLTLLAPDATTPASLTPERQGAALWPVVRAQLRALAAIEEQWTYRVQWATLARPTSRTTLISLLRDVAPVDNGDTAARWSRAARRYVDGL